MSIRQEKQAIRTQVLQRRQALTPAGVVASSMEIVRHLEALPPLQKAQTVGLYAPILQEVDPTALRDILLLRGVRLLYPRVTPEDGFPRLELAIASSSDDLQPGYRGIPEPQGPEIPATEMDVLLAPGIAFDAQGGRLGYGGGSYDELIQRMRKDAVVIGLAHAFQVMAELPREEHDQRVHAVATPSGVHRCPSA